MKHNFKNLEVWKKAMSLAESVYKLTAQLPSEEKFGLASQMNRSVVSIPSNIAEGSGRTSQKEFQHFVRIAIGSSFELETQLILAKNVGFLETELVEEILNQLDEVQKMMVGFSKSLASNF